MSPRNVPALLQHLKGRPHVRVAAAAAWAAKLRMQLSQVIEPIGNGLLCACRNEARINSCDVVCELACHAKGNAHPSTLRGAASKAVVAQAGASSVLPIIGRLS